MWLAAVLLLSAAELAATDCQNTLDWRPGRDNNAVFAKVTLSLDKVLRTASTTHAGSSVSSPLPAKSRAAKATKMHPHFSRAANAVSHSRKWDSVMFRNKAVLPMPLPP